MKYILSRYNHDISWVKEYIDDIDDIVMYDRSEIKLAGTPEMLVIPVENKGSDISDKFKFIVDNYNNLPDVALYSKVNLFKYCPQNEFELLKDKREFIPLLSHKHLVKKDICWYNNGIYCEVNNFWYLGAHPCKSEETMNEMIDLLGLRGRKYLEFAPGSNYILTKQNILKHPRELYIKLKSLLDWNVYPGEAQICERGLYYLWK